MRVDDVLGLRSDALLVRWTNLGTERAGGGAYERQFLRLCVFGADGLLTRIELFDADRDAEALARFDELTPLAARTRAPRSARRVRPNAATAHAARLDAAIAARDADALATLLADESEVVDHPTGATLRPAGSALARFAALLSARDPTSPARAARDPRRLARAVPLVDGQRAGSPAGRSTSAPTRARTSS